MDSVIAKTAVLTAHEPRPVIRSTLAGIGTAIPKFRASQDLALDFALKALPADSPVSPGLVRRIYRNSGINFRQSVLEDFLQPDPSLYRFFPQNAGLQPAPGTARRMSAYEEHALPLAVDAARAALQNSGVEPRAVTHLIITTCTGFFAPGLDILLLRHLGIPTSAQRNVLGFMGCYAGASAMRLCSQIATADPGAVVLQVSVELCSLHYQSSPSVEAMVSNAIFSDGAAAAIYLGDAAAEAWSPTEPLADVVAAHSDISPDSLDRMSWRIGDSGFIMTLDPGVSQVLQEHAPPFLASMAAKAEVDVAALSGWAVHPGGRKIVEAVRDALDLNDDDVASSTSVLSQYGNMSSATILFVLDEELRRREAGDYVAAMAFGPGLTMEGAILRRI